jgi:hypothetical protein
MVYCHSIAEFRKSVKTSYSLTYNATEAAMADGENMTLNEYREYLPLTTKRYLKAKKLERGCLLDEMSAITGLHGKTLIRLPPKASAQVNRVAP